MKKGIIFLGLTVLVVLAGFYISQHLHEPKHQLEQAKTQVNELVQSELLKEGDLIFQTSLSEQSKAIQLATNSKYSHCGILLKENGQFYVFEAIQPVKSTPLEQWIARGKDGHYVIKRLKNAEKIITLDVLQKMKQESEKFKGKKYDSTFEWSDDKIYCSELIWKIYHRATGIEIGKLQHLRDFDLTHEVVQQKMKERYGDSIPTEEIVISPAAIFESELLEVVKTNE